MGRASRGGVMSTPAREVRRQIFIDADEPTQRRRLLDESDTQRRIILNILCEQCERQVLFSKCKLGSDLGECVIEIVRARLDERRGD